jgi:hypothetical protein
VEIVYFPLPPLTRLYWNWPSVQRFKESMLDNVNRDNPEEKLSDFQQRSLNIIILM